MAYTQLPPKNGFSSLMVLPATTLPSPATQIFAKVPPVSHMVNQLKVDSSGRALGVEHAGLVHFDDASSTATTGQWSRIDFTAGTTLAPAIISADTTPPCAPDEIFTIGGVPPQIIARTLTDATSSFVIYDLPGADGTCGTADDVFRVLNYSGTSAEAPITLDGPIIGVMYDASGHLASVVEQVADTLRFISDVKSFSGGKTITSGVLSASSITDIATLQLNGAGISLGFGQQLFLLVFDSSRNTTVHRIDANGNYSPTLYTAETQGSLLTQAATDASNLYLLEEYAPLEDGVQRFTTNQIQIPLDGSIPGKVTATFSGETMLLQGSTTHNLIAQASFQAGGYAYVRLPKVQSGVPSSTTLSNGQPSYITANGLFFNPANPSGGAPAVLTDENEVPIASYAQSQWGGTYYQPASAALNPQMIATQILLARGDGSNGSSPGNDTLSVANDRNQLTLLTASDGSNVIFSGENFLFGSSVSPDTGILRDARFSQDIFAVDFDRHIVARVTNSPSTWEYPLN